MHPERILVVDDEESIRDVICSMLAPAYECEAAASGEEALARLREEPRRFSLLLSDLMMGGMHGFTLLEHVRKQYPDISVIVVTAVLELSVALNAIRNGAYDYLLKPFEREQLLAAVRRALEHRRLLIENRRYQDDLEALVAARTTQLRQAMERLERSYDITLEALGDALDLKDAETEGHSKRVTAFTIAIARAMELPAAEIRMIARGAFLHDIGKMAIPDEILRKQLGFRGFVTSDWGAVHGVNYGFDRVRFVHPVRSGSRVRAHFTLHTATLRSAREWRLTYEVSVEIEGVQKPALAANWLTMQVMG